jgi:hypothetical protein
MIIGWQNFPRRCGSPPSSLSERSFAHVFGLIVRLTNTYLLTPICTLWYKHIILHILVECPHCDECLTLYFHSMLHDVLKDRCCCMPILLASLNGAGIVKSIYLTNSTLSFQRNHCHLFTLFTLLFQDINYSLTFI